MKSFLNTWTVYFDTKDHPKVYCSRRFEGIDPTSDIFVNADVTAVRQWIHEESKKFDQGVPMCLPRSLNDDPVIVEVWL
ncbi:MAG: hypothetical protein EOO52_13405 [Gammaproteobacteria bacterium]|nr:MAG: hypothetical protein EOO52_13405 [Gammaproteobacteria bacterium]